MQVSLTQAVRNQLLEKRDQLLYMLAETAINVSPVDTGAYVESFEITTISGGGRGYTSHGRPKNQNPAAKKREALSQISADIASIPPNVTKIYLTNRAPHAAIVEGLGPAPMAFARQQASRF